MDITVNCKSADSLPIDRLLEFQGDLKKLTKANRDKLQKSIERHGFIAPIFVWDNAGDYMILDGHQRLATLLYMRRKGFTLPMIPVDYIHADSEADARDKLLHITSQYGEFNVDELNGWLEAIDSELTETIRIVNEEIDMSTFRESPEGWPELSAGDNPEYQQMTFILHARQAETVKATISALLAAGHGKSDDNANGPGNALYYMALQAGQ